MKLWLRKVFVVVIAFMTLGMYIPPTYIHTEAAENNEVSAKEQLEEDTYPSTENNIKNNDIDLTTRPAWRNGNESDDSHIQYLTEHAKDQAISKMGPKIIEKVDVDFTNDILPKIEEVVETLLGQAGEEEIPYYEITEELSPGYGEKIFNLYNLRTEEELARFHVRREKKPGEGYWFNFHYHVSKDGFEEHHTIGDLYWDKNTPPKWMS